MIQGKHERLHGWGRTPRAECLSFRPEKERELRQILTRHDAPVIARGLGRAYGDAALQPQGVVRTERLNHILAFDDAKGILHAQAGVTFSDILKLMAPKGWLLPVIPGTRHVTLGGAFACNVHGKNHFNAGEFAEHVTGISLITPDGERTTCSPELNSDLFWATAGGMGMTGIIETVTLQLKPIASASLRTLTYRVSSIEDMLAAFEHYRSQSDYMVGWIDHMADEKDIGRGVFEAASHISASDGGQPVAQFTLDEPKLSVPFTLPSFTLNRYTMALYNHWRFRQYGTERKEATVGFNGFFHPLDAIGHWNRLYGKPGFFQYQCLLPETPDVARHLRTLLTALAQKRMFSYLAVIKYHRDGKGMLTFSKQGYSLALDFPNTARVRHILPQIDRFIADHGGRVYLAKDALLSPELFQQMYGQAAHDWCDFIRRLDPKAQMHSLMSGRLQWKTGR